jgi:hypothetical protein
LVPGRSGKTRQPIAAKYSAGCDWRIHDAADIASGHANGKHASEFPGMSAKDLEAHVKDVMSNPLRTKDLKKQSEGISGSGWRDNRDP